MASNSHVSFLFLYADVFRPLHPLNMQNLKFEFESMTVRKLVLSSINVCSRILNCGVGVMLETVDLVL